MKKLLALLLLSPLIVIANPTSGWNEDYSYSDNINTGWSLGGDPVFWGLVLFFGILYLISEIQSWNKPNEFDDYPRPKKERIGCLIPIGIMVVLGILFFVNY